MAHEIALKTISKEAAGDLSSNQYHFVAINVAGQAAGLGVAGAKADGVLQNAPVAIGQAAAVAIGGQTKVLFGGTVASGANIASDVNGRAVAAVAGNQVLGTCTEGGADGEIGSMIFQPSGVSA